MEAEFLLTTLVVVAAPGTGVLYTLAAGMERGWRAGMWAALGCTLGIVPHLLVAVAGLSVLFQAGGPAFAALRGAGVAYLLLLAVAAVRQRGGGPAATGRRTPTRAGATVLSGVLLNLLNPKLSLFFLALLPQFVPGGTAEPTRRVAALGLVFMAMTLAVFAGYGVLAAGLRSRLLRCPRVLGRLRLVFAVAFVVMAVRLALWTG